MRLRAGLALSVLCCVLLAGCARPPEDGPELTAYAPPQRAVETPARATETAARAAARFDSIVPPAPAATIFRGSGRLAGRTLVADSVSDLILRRGEVILTFDDGPRPGKTERILETLDDFGVHAVFLMLGQSALSHPELTRAVAEAGHTIGSHTYDHPNLSLMPPRDAMIEIHHGHAAVADALNAEPSRFFRFPYLAQSHVLRTHVAADNMIVLGVDVDSSDYFRETPAQVLARTLARLDAQGQGIILFHDIHARTVELLPAFLATLEERGYSVVTLRSRGTSVFDTEIIATAE